MSKGGPLGTALRVSFVNHLWERDELYPSVVFFWTPAGSQWREGRTVADGIVSTAARHFDGCLAFEDNNTSLSPRSDAA
jgi:hypothetical protein